MPYSTKKTIENGMTLKPPIGRFSIKATHKGVPSVSMSRRFGILSGLPRLEFRSMKGAMFHFLHSSKEAF